MSLLDLVARLILDTSEYERALSTAESKAELFGYTSGSAIRKSAKIIAAGVAAATTAVGKFGFDAVRTGMNFGKSMSQVASTMGETADGIEDNIGSVDTSFGRFEGNLRDFALFLGKNTAFSATQAAEALNYMALAGYDTQQSMEMLPNVLNLAAAGSFDLARASDMVTDAQTAFGITSERTTQMVDEMAKAASTGNTSVEQLGDAFLVVGGLAAELNGGMITLANGTETGVDGVQELEIALTAMANAGVKGAEAGTHMRNMLLKLSSPTDEGTKALEDMGVAVFDADGKMRSLSGIFGDLSTQLSKMKQGDKIKVISQLFNTRDLASAEALLKAVGSDWDRIGEAILDAKGAAAQMAETQLDNLAGDITLFKSALEGAQIVVSDQLTPTIRDFVKIATSGLQNVTTAFQQNGMKGAAEEFGTFLVDAIDLISQKLPEFVEAGTGLLMSFVGGILDKAPEIVSAIAQCVSLVISALAEKAPDIIGTFVDALIGIIDAITQPEFLSSLIQAVVELFVGFVQGINEAIPKIIDALPTIIENIVQALTAPESISAIIEGAVELFFGIIKAIPQIIVALVENMPQIIGAIVEGLVAGVGAVIEAAFTLFGGISTASEEVAEKTKEDAQATRDFIQTLKDIQPDLVNYNGLLSDQGHTLGELKNTHQEVQGKINEITSNALKERRELTEEEIAQIKELKAQLKSLETESFSVYHNRQEAILTSAKRIESVTAEEAQKIIANAKDAAEKAKAAALEQYYGRLEAIENEKFATAEELEEMRTKAQQEYDAMVLTAEGYVSKTASALTDGAREWVSTQQDAWKEMNAGFRDFKESQLSEMIPFHESISGLFSQIGGSMNEIYKNGLDSIEMNSAAAWLNLIGESKKSGDTLAAQDVKIVERMLEPFKDLPVELEGTGKETLDGLVEGLKDKVPALQDTSKMSAQEIVDAVESFLEINSPSRVMKRIGGYAIEGLIDGMNAKKSGIESTATSIASAMKTAADGQTSSYYNIGYNMAEGMRQGFLNQEYRLTSSVSNMISRVNYAARAKLDIHSPSKVWMKMGEQTGEGFEIGLHDSMGDAIIGMKDMFDDMESFSPVMSAPEIQPQANTGRNYVEQVVININAADFDSIDDLADAVSQRMWEATEQKERSYA